MTSNSGVALAVFAHADDETLLAGALIPKLIDDGWRVHLLCLAPGDDEDLGARMELAAGELGIESVSSLRFAPDGSTAGAGRIVASPPLLSAPETAIASQVEGKIAALSPGMIITHSPRGDYGHPDHACCHRVTVEAARAAAPSAAVFALAWPRSALWLNAIAAWLLRPFGARRRPAEGFRGAGATDAKRLPVTEIHTVSRFLSIRKRAARHYKPELRRGPLSFRLLEAAPAWMQRPVLGKARLSRVR